MRAETWNGCFQDDGAERLRRRFFLRFLEFSRENKTRRPSRPALLAFYSSASSTPGGTAGSFSFG